MVVVDPTRSLGPGVVPDARWRALLAFAAFASGLLIARELPGMPSAAWAGLGALAAALAIAIPSRWARVSVAAAMLAAGGANWAWQISERPAGSVAGWLEAKQSASGDHRPPTLIEIEGIVLSPTERIEPMRGRLSALVPEFLASRDRASTEVAVSLVLTDAGPRRASGVAVVTTEAPAPAVRAGDRVRVRGFARATSGPSNPGEIDFRPLARDRGDRFWIAADRDATIERLPHPTLASSLVGGFRAVLAWPRERSRAVIDAATDADDDAGRLVRGLILGQRDTDGPGLAGAFQRVGLAHLLSVSGFHVAVMAFVALLAVRLTGDRGSVEPMIVAVALALYMLVVPVRAPILRAGFMVLVLLISDGLGRRHDRLTLLAWIGVAVLALRPTDLFSIGFQLSFGLVAWLMLVATPRPDRIVTQEFHDPAEVPLWRLPLNALRTTAIATAACWSLSLPLIWYHTGAVAPLAIVATVITVPLIVATMWLGFALLLAASLSSSLIAPFAAAMSAVAGACAAVVRWFDTVPIATVTVPRVSLAWTVLATLAIAYVWRRGRWRSMPMWSLLGLVALWLAVEVNRAPFIPSDTELRATMLDVGNGTAIVVERGSDALLWDAGSMRESIGVRTIDDACRAIGAHSVHTVVITHANIDHYMGVLDIAKPLGIKRVITGESFTRQALADPDGAAAYVLSELARLGIEHRAVAAGDTIPLGDTELTVIHPPPGFTPRSENDASLVAIADIAGRRLMLTGDIQDEAIATLLNAGVDLRADIMELPHHGSARDAAYAFVERVDPSLVLQSTGVQRLNDPRWDAQRRGRAWLVTARDGAIRAEITRAGEARAQPVR